jgi:peroxiredoxin
MHLTLTPGDIAPALSFPRISGKKFVLSEQKPEHFTLIMVYRGLHCPVCRKHLGQLDEILDDFSEAGINVVAVSMDDKQRADEQHLEWPIENLDVGYDLSRDMAKAWGLYLSGGERDGEPEVFAEPAHFAIRPDGVIQAVWYQNVSFGRPPFEYLLSGLKTIVERDMPIRGRWQG